MQSQSTLPTDLQFPIPVRGNEEAEREAEIKAIEVSDPHEG